MGVAVPAVLLGVTIALWLVGFWFRRHLQRAALAVGRLRLGRLRALLFGHGRILIAICRLCRVAGRLGLVVACHDQRLSESGTGGGRGRSKSDRPGASTAP